MQKVMPQFAAGLEQLNAVASETLMQTKHRLPPARPRRHVQRQEPGERGHPEGGLNMVENSLHESFPEPPIAVAPKVASRQAEAVAIWL